MKQPSWIILQSFTTCIIGNARTGNFMFLAVKLNVVWTKQSIRDLFLARYATHKKGDTIMTKKIKFTFIGIILLFLIIICYQQWQIKTLEKQIQPVDLSQVDSRLDSLERDTRSLKSDVKDLNSSVSMLNSDYSSLSSNIDSINNSINDLNNNLNEMSIDTTYMPPLPTYPTASTSSPRYYTYP